MDSITLENYRCFREKQSARLAPLTLLVGNNSTGKTSFLALIRALWDTAFLDRVPDFREDPFDLGTFQDIAHNRGGRGSQAASFAAGFEYRKGRSRTKGRLHFSFEVRFVECNAVPFPEFRSMFGDNVELRETRQEDGSYLFHLSTPDFSNEAPFELPNSLRDEMALFPLKHIVEEWGRKEPKGKSREIAKTLYDSLWSVFEGQRPVASAPIRSRPQRTYDPTRPSRDPEGEYVPTYLAGISSRSNEEWAGLRKALEAFGQESGLFDEIDIKLLGKTEGSPFQVRIRKFGHRLKGVKRNLIDVGYGVSQALPLLTELLRKDAPSMYLLQQPEIHLHPSAQAALGSLFCKIAGPNRQLIVETHSNYILDRVRMDIRDKKSDLKPEDISILFFEPGELDVTIHSLRIDQDGNVLDAPPGYGQFFIDETRRSIGI